MVQPGLNYNQCIECQQIFHPHIPEYLPRLLDCSHCICTQCLTPMIRDLNRLHKVTDYSRPYTATSITCTVCGYQSRVTNDNIDRFPVNYQLFQSVTRNPNEHFRHGCSHSIRFEKFCEECKMMFCSSCMPIHIQIHEARNLEKNLDTLHKKVADDLTNLKFLTHRGSKDLEEHYYKLMQSLKNKYESVLGRFNNKSIKLKHKFERQLVSIETEKFRLDDSLRTNGTSYLSKSIHDSHCLMNKTYQENNIYEIDKLNNEVEIFKDIKIKGRPNHLSTLPPIEGTSRESSQDLSQSVEGALLTSAVSQLNLDRVQSPLYNAQPLLTPQHGTRTPRLTPLQRAPQPARLQPPFSGGHTVNSPSRSKQSPFHTALHNPRNFH